MTKDPLQSVRLSSKRSVVATLGQVLSSLLTVRLVAAIGQGDQGKGYFTVYLIYSIVACIGYQLVARICIQDYDFYKVAQAGEKEREKLTKKAEEQPTKNKVPFKIYIKAYTSNLSPLSLLIGDACKASATLLYSG